MTRILILALAALLSLVPTDHLTAGVSQASVTAIEGEAFDRAFVDQMLRDEQEAVEQLKR